MSRLRELQRRSKNRRSIAIEDTCIKDLNVMLFFMEKAKNGIDLNQLAFRKPTYIY